MKKRSRARDTSVGVQLHLEELDDLTLLCLDIRHLMVHPSHQKQGVGAKLLADVVARSDEERIPAYIVSSLESHGLYAKLGFEDLKEFPIDNEYWARRIEETESELGITANKGLAEKCRGIKEVDTGMVRWPR